MTMTLMTGLPGAGKTLHALTHIKARSEKENREVFYHGISELNLERWVEFKAEEWWSLPDGAMIVIDECQFVFPTKANGASLPDHYDKLAIHRSRGFDIFLITQHPTLVHNFVRKLVGQHFHSVRGFGEVAKIYEWSQTNPAPENVSSQKSAVSKRWTFNKEAYTWYKSAEVHTVKRKLPAKVFYVLIFVVLVIAALIYWIQSKQTLPATNPDPALVGDVVAADENVTVMADAGKVSQGGYNDPIDDAKRYMWERTPRVEGIPETAPRYDALTVATRVPVPAMCVQIGDAQTMKPVRCQCYTQQATKLDIPFNTCIDIARNGRFMDFDAEPNKQRDTTAVQLADASQASRSARVLGERRPDVAQGPVYESRPITSFDDVPSALQGARPPPNLNDGPPRDRTTRTEVAP